MERYEETMQDILFDYTFCHDSIKVDFREIVTVCEFGDCTLISNPLVIMLKCTSRRLFW